MNKHILIASVVLSFSSLKLLSQTMNVTRPDNSSVIADFAVGEFRKSDKMVDGKFYHSFASEYATLMADPQIPALPYFPRSVLISDDSLCQHQILYESYVDIPDIDIEAASGSVNTGKSGKIYHLDAFFPGDLVTFHDAQTCKSTGGEIKFELYPYQYNPVQHKLRIYKNLRLIIRMVNSSNVFTNR